MKDGDKYIEVTLVVEAENGMYVSRCPELGTASCGDTFEEAETNILDAILCHLNTLEELGERPRFFRERGIRMKTYKTPKGAPVPKPLNVPLRPDAWATRRKIRVPLTA